MKEFFSKPTWFIYSALGFVGLALSFYSFSINPIAAHELPTVHWILFTVSLAVVTAGIISILAPIFTARYNHKFKEMKELYENLYKPLFDIIITLGVMLEIRSSPLIAAHKMKKNNRLWRPLFDCIHYFRQKAHDRRFRPSAEVAWGNYGVEREAVTRHILVNASMAPTTLLELHRSAEAAREEVEHSLAHLNDYTTYVSPEEVELREFIYGECKRLERKLGRTK